LDERQAPAHQFLQLERQREKNATSKMVRPMKPALDAETEHAARAFMQRVEGRYPVREGILFGSRARHAHGRDSDADIAVVLKGPHGDRTAAALDMAGIAFDVLLETGVLVEALPLWEDELKHPNRFMA
jgi:predicted nucleotidyltransferase